MIISYSGPDCLPSYRWLPSSRFVFCQPIYRPNWSCKTTVFWYCETNDIYGNYWPQLSSLPYCIKQSENTTINDTSKRPVMNEKRILGCSKTGWCSPPTPQGGWKMRVRWWRGVREWQVILEPFEKKNEQTLRGHWKCSSGDKSVVAGW